jgi:SNF2 family DNA or RNA helicase
MSSKTYGKLKRYGRYWGVETDPAVMIILKRWFPRVNPNRDGVLMVSATAEVSRNLAWFQMRYPMEMRGDHRQLLETEAEADKSLEFEAADILAGGQLKRELKWEIESPPAPGEPRDYQLIGANLALRTGHLLIADDVGLGKTVTSLLILRDAGLLPALIVCQTHLPQQWLEEIEDFLPWLTGHIARKGTPYKLAKYHKGKAPNVLILNYAKLAGWAPKLKGAIKAVILDEGQELRREGTQKYDAAGLVADAAECVAMTTATPIYNYGDEIYNVMDIVKRGCLGEREEFVREWGKPMGNHMGVKDPRALRQHLINQNLMIQRTRKEVGRELPETLKVRHAIESDDAAFEKLMEGAERTADILVTREASREELFQLSGDFEWQMRRATGIAKAPFVAEFAKSLLESGEQLVMFGWHHAVYDIWRDALKDFNPAFYTGQETPAKKLIAKQQFISGESKVLCMSLRSGAGLDGLQEVSHIALFGELDWSPTMHEQCIGRLRRDGMDETVVAYFLVSENGSDPMIADVLNLKRTQSEPFMDPESKLLSVTEQKGSRAKEMAEHFLAK